MHLVGFYFKNLISVFSSGSHLAYTEVAVRMGE